MEPTRPARRLAFARILALAGRAAHLEAVRQRKREPPAHLLGAELLEGTMARTLTLLHTSTMLLVAFVASCSVSPHPSDTPVPTGQPQEPPIFDEMPPRRLTATAIPEAPTSAPFKCQYPELSNPDSSQIAPLDPGMYVAYFVDQPESRYLAIKSTQGVTVRLLPVPPKARLPDPEAETGVSPNGRFFVYFTGGPTWLQPADEFDLTLHIATTAGGTVVSSTPLFNSHTLDDIDNAAISYANDPSPGQEAASIEEIASGLIDALLAGITTVAWSPDSRYLAFSGAMDGPSSDVYTYDTTTGTLRRLTTGREEIVKIVWSPDGEWIMHGSATSAGMGSSLTNHAVRADGSATMSFPFGGPFDRGWLTDRRFLVNEGANGIGSYDLAILDLDTGRRLSVWADPFGALAFDATGSRFLLGSFGDIEGSPPAGLYMLQSSTGESSMIADFPLFDVAYWPSSLYPFVAASEEGGLFGVTSAGELVPLLEGQWTIFPAPDLSSLALRGHDETNGLFVFDSPEATPRPLHDGFIRTVKWSPDSSSILFSYGEFTQAETLAAVPAVGGDTRVFQELPRGMCFFPEPVWITVK